MAQWVEHLTSAQVMISRFVGLSPTSGSVLTAQSLAPASDCVSLSLCTSSACTLSLSFQCLFIFERERESMSGGAAEREGDTI